MTVPAINPERESLADQLVELADRIAHLEAELDGEDRCATNGLHADLTYAVLSFHESIHGGAFRLCNENPCRQIPKQARPLGPAPWRFIT